MSSSKPKKKLPEVKPIKNPKLKKESKEKKSVLQEVFSIIFTILVFLLLVVLIAFLYQKYLQNKTCDPNKICVNLKDEEDKFNENDLKTFIYQLRYVIYPVDEFSNKKLNDDKLEEITKYFLWGSDYEYLECDEDESCLETKKEMEIEELQEKFLKYFNKNLDASIFQKMRFDEDVIRMYSKSNKMILTFNNIEFSTLKHEIVDIHKENQEIIVSFVLLKKLATEEYGYYGIKKVKFEQNEDGFYIKSIETSKN